MSMVQQDSILSKMLGESWRREMEAAQLYGRAAELEKDHSRRSLLSRLANIEQSHADIWAGKLHEVGVPVPRSSLGEYDSAVYSNEALLQQLDALEHSNAAWYEFLRHVFDDREIIRIIDRIDEEESHHDSTVHSLFAAPALPIGETLQRIWGAERFHKREVAGWMGDAIYGVNDGLGAIFGIIAGIAGYTANSHTVLVGGFFGAVASTLSMGVGAWLSTRSKNELAHSEQQHERREIMDNLDEEMEELQLLYQLKGFTENEAKGITERLSREPEQLLKAMNQEELGLTDDGGGNPWTSAGIGSLSTFIGGILPLIPFFFLTGVRAIVVAALVSILAHFAVGAAKSVVTVRRWWASGLEMTVAGVLVGVVSYGVGILGTMLLHA